MTALGVFLWGAAIFVALTYIESAVVALKRAQEDANQIARDQLSLDRQRFERDGRAHRP